MLNSDKKIGYNILNNKLIMLLYEDKNKLDNFTRDIVNEGLKNDYFCVFGYIDSNHSNHSSSIGSFFSKILNYNENIENENLKIVNFKPFYESALKRDLTLFENLRLELEEIYNRRLSDGKKGKIIIIANAACNLSESRNFYECVDLENWWQEVNLDWKRNNKNITVVCPHPNYIFKDSEQDIKNKIIGLHDTAIHIENEYSFRDFYSLITNIDIDNCDVLFNYEKAIRNMKLIKNNFMKEHKNIINTYYSIFSSRIDEIIYNTLDKSTNDIKYSEFFKNNQSLVDSQKYHLEIINDIIDNNLDTFIKSIEYVHKFYYDVVQSYYKYIMTIKESPKNQF